MLYRMRRRQSRYSSDAAAWASAKSDGLTLIASGLILILSNCSVKYVTADTPFSRTSLQIRSTTCVGVSTALKTACESFFPAGVIVSPSGEIWALNLANWLRPFDSVKSMRRTFREGMSNLAGDPDGSVVHGGP